MTHEAFEELAHAALEGTATPEQRAALEAQLASDPIARSRWLELETAFEALGRLQPVAPPLDLKPAVMRAIHAERRAAGAPSQSGGGGPWGRLLGFRLASAFAAGAVAGVLVWSLATGSRGTLGNLPAGGTMMPQPGKATAIDRISLATGTAAVTIEVLAVPGGVTARIDAHTGDPMGEPAEIVLEYDAALEAKSLEGIEAQPWRASLAPGSVGLEFGREIRCSVLLRGPDAASRPIRVTLHSGGTSATGVLGESGR